MVVANPSPIHRASVNNCSKDHPQGVVTARFTTGASCQMANSRTPKKDHLDTVYFFVLKARNFTLLPGATIIWWGVPAGIRK